MTTTTASSLLPSYPFPIPALRNTRGDALAAVTVSIALARAVRPVLLRTGSGERRSIVLSLSEAVFAAAWLAVLLLESVAAVAARGCVFVVEVVCALLDWVGAEY